MRIFADRSGNGMGVGIVDQAFLEEIMNASNTVSEAVQASGNFNVSMRGTFVASVRLERSLDNGITYAALTAAGDAYTTYDGPMSETFYEPEPQALYRFVLASYSSGSVIVRIGK